MRGQKTMETIKEEEKESEQGGLRLREWTKENDEMENIYDPYYEL